MAARLASKQPSEVLSTTGKHLPAPRAVRMKGKLRCFSEDGGVEGSWWEEGAAEGWSAGTRRLQVHTGDATATRNMKTTRFGPGERWFVAIYSRF